MNHIYGSGYMYLCASHYQGNFPEKEYAFFNRGISGNTLRLLKTPIGFGTVSTPLLQGIDEWRICV